MLPTQNIDSMTLQKVRELVRSNFAARDELYAAAEELDDEALSGICRRLADDLGGNAADLQQLLMVEGQSPAEPDGVVRRLQEIVIETLASRHGPNTVLAEAEAAEQQLKEDYDSVIEATPDDQVEGLLRSQREDVAFGATVLRKVRGHIESPPQAGLEVNPTQPQPKRQSPR